MYVVYHTQLQGHPSFFRPLLTDMHILYRYHCLMNYSEIQCTGGKFWGLHLWNISEQTQY